MSTKPRTDVRLLNLCKRMRTLAELEKLHSIKALAEEIEFAVKALLQEKS